MKNNSFCSFETPMPFLNLKHSPNRNQKKTRTINLYQHLSSSNPIFDSDQWRFEKNIKGRFLICLAPTLKYNNISYGENIMTYRT